MDRKQRIFDLLADNPQDPFLHFALAKEYEKENKQDEALTAYKKLVAEFPDYVGTYYHLGKLYERQNDPDRAADVYEAGMKIARAQGDNHSYSELAGAKMILE